MARRNWDHGSPAFSTDAQFSNRPLFISSPGHSMGYEVGHYVQGQLASRETHQHSLDLTSDIVRAFDKPHLRSDQPTGNENQEIRGDREVTGFDKNGHPPSRPGQGDYPPGSPLSIMRTIEHQGLVVLSWLVPLYIVVWQLIAVGITLVAFSLSRPASTILQQLDENTFFFSFFTIVAAFTNSGVPANDADLVPFQSQCFLLVLFTLVSLMGNLLYPACLRFIIWILHSLVSSSRKPVYGYLLNHPRRCFTHLFPYKQSVWLCLTVLGFTGFQLIFFCALDWDSEALEGLKPISKIVDGIYQSVSARNAGGDVVDISELVSPMLVLYLFMM